MKVPKFLDKLLSDDDNTTAPVMQQGRDPVTDPNYIPHSNTNGAAEFETSPNKKKKKKKSESAGPGPTDFLKNKSFKILLAVFAFVLVLSVVTLPKKPKDAGPRIEYIHDDSSRVMENIEFSIIKTDTSEEIVVDEEVEKIPDEGNAFFSVTLAAKNVAPEARTLGKEGKFGTSEAMYSFSLIFSDSYHYNSFTLPNNENFLENYKKKIIPLQSIVGEVCFEVPKEVISSDAALGFVITQLDTKDTSIWMLREPPNEAK